MSSEIAIDVQNLGKCFEVYDKPKNRLKQFILPRVQQLLGIKQQRYFREFWGLKNVSFQIKKGETVGVIGRNGAGKSTLLQMICGTLTPTTGEIQVNGRVAALLELGSGFNPEFTGRENVFLCGAVLGLTRNELETQLNDIIKFADIGDFFDQPVKTYSSGMYVRLAFAVVAHVNADILVIDEALSVGDVFFTQKCMRFLREFAQRGTLLFVSHDIGSILGLCDRALWLQNGHLHRIGLPKELAAEYLEALYDDSLEPKIKKESTSEIEAECQITLDHAVTSPKSRLRDMRQEFVNQTPLRNDIELFEFQPDALSFGEGGAKIKSIWLEDTSGDRLTWVVGGEDVAMVIECEILDDLSFPIVGFYVKDYLGQSLFGDNTYLTYVDKPISIQKGKYLRAKFLFRMPILPKGDYSVSAAIAEGTQSTHTQHHWAHDVLAFHAHSTSVSTGLIGIPMSQITLQGIEEKVLKNHE